MIRYEDEKLLRMKGTIFPRNSNFVGETSTNISPIRLWHVRYGHLNFESLSQPQNKGMVKGLPSFKKENAKFKAFIYEKQNRDTFPTSSWHGNKHLQLVHSDICGPLQASLGGCRYFLLFIDNFSRMMGVYFLKQKL
jgi:hypothetical protein